jgi:hypothetical protein
MENKVDYSKMSPEELAGLFNGEAFANWDDALAWVHSQNPNMENNHPEDLDWQAIKAAARRY